MTFVIGALFVRETKDVKIHQEHVTPPLTGAAPSPA